MKYLRFFNLIVILFMVSGCSSSPVDPTEIPIPPTLAQPDLGERPTISVNPTLTPTPQVTLTSSPIAQPSLTPTIFSPFSATVWADGVKLRNNPGYLFPALRLLSQNTNVQVFGHTPGDEWIYVSGPNNSSGWIYAQLLNSTVDLTESPQVEPGNVQMLRGRITNLTNQPVSGIHFAIVQGNQRNDAITDENGYFIAFMPETSSGAWQVSFTAVACTSNTMDEDCNCIDDHCGTVNPPYMDVNLPFSDT